MFTDPDVQRSLDTIVDQNATIIQLLEQLVQAQGSFESPSTRYLTDRPTNYPDFGPQE